MELEPIINHNKSSDNTGNTIKKTIQYVTLKLYNLLNLLSSLGAQMRIIEKFYGADNASKRLTIGNFHTFHCAINIRYA